MRDKLKEKSFFDSFINERYSLINDINIKLKKNAIKDDRVPTSMWLMYSHYLYIIKAKYSRGDDMYSNEVLEDYNCAVKLLGQYKQMKENAGLLTYTEKGKTIYLHQYILSMHFDILDLLSLGVLLETPMEWFNILINILDKDNVKNNVYEFLIKSRDTNRRIEQENFVVFSWYKDRFFKLKNIILIEDKSTAEDELKSFLKSYWYKSLHDTPIYNQHNVKNGNYVGYWCFVSAAIVKIMGLDDSGFRDNPYYPKDLIK